MVYGVRCAMIAIMIARIGLSAYGCRISRTMAE
eukprot:COSAG01_NODE_46890_length_395_cov_9.226351_1_plen_32_part_01